MWQTHSTYKPCRPNLFFDGWLGALKEFLKAARDGALHFPRNQHPHNLGTRQFVFMLTQLAKFANQGCTFRQSDNLYRVERGLDDRTPKQSKNPGAILLSAAKLNPSVTPPSARMAKDLKNLHVALPNGLAGNIFMHSNGFYMFR
jgi:hypothetical protein